MPDYGNCRVWSNLGDTRITGMCSMELHLETMHDMHDGCPICAGPILHPSTYCWCPITTRPNGLPYAMSINLTEEMGPDQDGAEIEIAEGSETHTMTFIDGGTATRTNHYKMQQRWKARPGGQSFILKNDGGCKWGWATGFVTGFTWHNPIGDRVVKSGTFTVQGNPQTWKWEDFVQQQGAVVYETTWQLDPNDVMSYKFFTIPEPTETHGATSAIYSGWRNILPFLKSADYRYGGTCTHLFPGRPCYVVDGHPGNADVGTSTTEIKGDYWRTYMSRCGYYWELSANAATPANPFILNLYAVDGVRWMWTKYDNGTIYQVSPDIIVIPGTPYPTSSSYGGNGDGGGNGGTGINTTGDRFFPGNKFPPAIANSMAPHESYDHTFHGTGTSGVIAPKVRYGTGGTTPDNGVNAMKLATWTSAAVACNYNGKVKLNRVYDWRTTIPGILSGPTSFPQTIWLDIGESGA